MDELIVDLAVLRCLADSIVEHIDATGSSLDELDGIVNDLEATWKGEGRDGFTTRSPSGSRVRVTCGTSCTGFAMS